MTTMQTIWSKVIQFMAKIFRVGIVPPEVTDQATNLSEWWEVYRAKAPWLDYNYVTADGVHRQRRRMTLNPAKIACSEIAGLVLNEMPELKLSPKLEAVLKLNNFWSNFRRAFEYQAALGGQAIKIYKTGDTIGLDFVKAYNFVPLAWDNCRITEASFIDRRTVGKDQMIRVETHRKTEGGYTIESRAFIESTGIETSLERGWPGVEQSVTVATEYPLFVYIANPEANNIDPESPLGISIFGNSVDTIQSLDMAFDGFKTEVLMGRQRIALPGIVMRRYLDPDSGTYKRGFDPTDEAYVRLEGDDKEGIKPTDLSGQLRVTEFINAIQAMLDLYAIQIGFDAGYFSFDGKSMKTATEVISENSHTYKTIQAYRETVKEALLQLFAAIQSIAGETGEIMIQFDDGIIEDRNSKTKYYTDLVLNGLARKAEAIAAIRGISLVDAEKIAEQISSETQQITTGQIFGDGL